jgi:uroporphyrinogen-III synthase
VVSAQGDVDDLARVIVSKAANKAGGGGPPLLYLAGNDRSGDLAAALADVGRVVETVIAYRAVAVGSFDADAREAIVAGRIDAVLHYSARTAQAFITAAQAAGVMDFAMKIMHFCLSPQVAVPLAAVGARTILIAEAPNETALFTLIEMP